MSFNSIFTALSSKERTPRLLDMAMRLAGRFDAHLEALCLGVDTTQTGYYYAGASAVVLQDQIARATADAEALEAMARKEMQGASLRYGTDTAVCALADLNRHVAMRARFSDMAVFDSPYYEGAGAEPEAIVEAALFEGRVPVLVLPDSEGSDKLVDNGAQTVVLAWNESPEALTAARAALPMLKQARKVSITVIDPPRHGPDRSDPGGPLSQYLARHGVNAEIDVLAKSMPRVSDVLLRHASDIEAGLVVMGAYGHSRFREAILGGATRYMLEQTSVPVFLAH